MSKKRTGLKVAIGVGIVLVGMYSVYALKARLALNHELELAKNEGLYTTLDELADRPAPPADKNAALIYQPLCKSYHDGVPSIGASTEKALAPGGEAAFEEAYLLAEPYLSQFERAASMPDCQFQRDWRLGAAVLFPEFSELRSVQQVITIKAMLLSRHGHPIEGLNLIRRFAPMAHQTASDPIMISVLDGVSMESLEFRAIQAILGAHGLEPGVPDAARSVLDAMGPELDPLPAISGECAMMSEALKHPEVGELLGLEGKDKLMGHLPPVRDRWATDATRYFRECYRAIKDSPHDFNRQVAGIHEAAAKRGSDLEGFALGFFEDSFWILPRDTANRSALATLIVGLKEWQKSGSPPKSLPVTNPPVVDPLTDQSLHFALIPGGFKVWCVSGDGIDHGGTVYSGKGNQALDDIDTTYEYPYAPPPQAGGKR